MAVNWGGRKDNEVSKELKMGDPTQEGIMTIDENTNPLLYLKDYLVYVRPPIKTVDGLPHPYNWFNIQRGKMALVNVDDEIL